MSPMQQLQSRLRLAYLILNTNLMEHQVRHSNQDHALPFQTEMAIVKNKGFVTDIAC
jgi:hypothetical protein